jgi:transcriptional regulator with XRE-family HTH domain
MMNWTVRQLAERSGVHRNTITRIEAGEAKHGPTIAAVVHALEQAGVAFTNGDEPGVKLKKRKVKVIVG